MSAAGGLIERWMERVCGIDKEIEEVRVSVTTTLTEGEKESMVVFKPDHFQYSFT